MREMSFTIIRAEPSDWESYRAIRLRSLREALGQPAFHAARWHADDLRGKRIRQRSTE